MEGMGECAHGRQRQQRGWPGQPASSLPGARATPAQPASGGGCLPQPRWAVCATGAGAHQGQTSREGEKNTWWTAGTARGGTGHLGLTHTETQQGRLWTACGQRRVDSKSSQTAPATTSTSSIRQLLGAADAQTAVWKAVVRLCGGNSRPIVVLTGPCFAVPRLTSVCRAVPCVACRRTPTSTRKCGR